MSELRHRLFAVTSFTLAEVEGNDDLDTIQSDVLALLKLARQMRDAKKPPPSARDAGERDLQ